MEKSFKEFMAKVDAILITRTGDDSNGLPDFDYAKAYAARRTPAATAAAAIRAALKF